MNIRNIEMENISIQSKKGLVCIEGEGITLKNSTLYCDDKTVVHSENSKNVKLDNIRFRPSDVMIQITGNRSGNIRLINTDVKNATKTVELGAGVPENVFSIK
jgi:DNA sulfur modification protein DndE